MDTEKEQNFKNKRNCEHPICKWHPYAGKWHYVCQNCIETQRNSDEPK